ncbi:hypothetical protein SLS60_002319 [Paraconiothyrium brasiliense]|uniref:Uncharacterized protein n=1 Tax=Paraconiothyrium brasiliense TaxID=300254 RepID=A0ABR3S2W5_9PLEO
MDRKRMLRGKASMANSSTKGKPANKMANISFDFTSLSVELRVLVYQAYLDVEVAKVPRLLRAQPDRYEPLHFGISHPITSDAIVGPLLSICYAFKGSSVESFGEIMRLAGLNSPHQPSGVYRIVLTGKPLPALPGNNYHGISEVIRNGGVMDSIREVEVLSHMEPGSILNPQNWLDGVTLSKRKSKPRIPNNRPKDDAPLFEERLSEYHARNLGRFVGVFEDSSRMRRVMTNRDHILLRWYHTLVEEYGADFESKPEFSNPEGDHEFHLLSVEQVVEQYRLRELLNCRHLKVARFNYSIGCTCFNPGCLTVHLGLGPIRAQEGSVRDATRNDFQELMRKVAFWLQNEFATKNRQCVFVQSVMVPQKEPSNIYYKQAP